jgi:hypothetical protein
MTHAHVALRRFDARRSRTVRAGRIDARRSRTVRADRIDARARGIRLARNPLLRRAPDRRGELTGQG